MPSGGQKGVSEEVSDREGLGTAALLGSGGK